MAAGIEMAALHTRDLGPLCGSLLPGPVCIDQELSWGVEWVEAERSWDRTTVAARPHPRPSSLSYMSPVPESLCLVFQHLAAACSCSTTPGNVICLYS